MGVDCKVTRLMPWDVTPNVQVTKEKIDKLDFMKILNLRFSTKTLFIVY